VKNKKFKVKFTKEELELHNAKVIQDFLRPVSSSQIGFIKLTEAIHKTRPEDLPYFMKSAENSNRYLFDV
jgi:hypothetical protein